MLLNFPPEILQKISMFLTLHDLCQLRRTCSYLRDVCDQESLWIEKCSNDYGMMVTLVDEDGQTFSPRAFYQNFLHFYQDHVGFWQEKNHWVGKLMNVRFVKEDKSLVFEEFEKPKRVHERVTKKNLWSLTFQNNEVKNASGIVRGEDTVTNADPIKNFIQINNQKQYWYPVLTPLWTSIYHMDHHSNNKRLASISGLFKGTYGPHGIEFIHLRDGQGVKVTGDPNVPYNEVTFRVIHGQMLDIPLDLQSSVDGVIKATEEYEQFAVDEDIATAEEYKFQIPEDMFEMDDDEQSLLQKKTCQGRWAAEAQVAGHHFTGPTFISANFILFSENEFAVMFLDLQSTSVYHRV